LVKWDSVKRLSLILRKYRVGVALGLVFLALGGFMVWGVFGPPSDRRLDAIRRSGYPVREADLEAWYPPVPDVENGALIYGQAFAQPGFTNIADWQEKSLPKDWFPPRGQVLSEETKSEVKDLLATHQAALGLLHSARARRRSRYPVQWNLGLDAPMPHLAQVKGAVILLRAEAMVHCADGNAEKAVQALLAAGHAADSLSAEPMLISHLVRISCWGLLAAPLERVINALPLTEDQLASLHAMVREAEKPQALARALGTDRVIGLAVFTDPKAQTRLMSGGRFEAGVAFGMLKAVGILQRDKAFYLDALSTNISIAEMPWPERVQLGQQGIQLNPARTNRFFILSSILLPSLAKTFSRDADHAARMRVALAALAVQRFRRAHNNILPTTLQELEPAWLNPVPADPYDGQPLRFRRQGSGFVIYSIGSDGQDDAGTERPAPSSKSAYDITFIVEN